MSEGTHAAEADARTDIPEDAGALARGIAEIEREIRNARAARRISERAATERKTAELGLEIALRDRDALSSPELEKLRSRASGLAQRLVAVWASVDGTRLNVGFLNNSGVNVRSDPGLIGGANLCEVLDQEAEARVQARTALLNVGLITIRVPEPASAGEPNIQQRNAIAEILDRIAEERADRERRSRKPRNPRSDQQGVKPRGAR